MPLVQGLQAELGSERLEVMLVSVDRSYGDLAKAREKAIRILEKQKVSWSSSFDPEGWGGVSRTLNGAGYGLIVVGPDGIVRGAGVRHAEAKKLLEAIFAKEK